ncbi:ninja-family protein Os03g0419100-like [Phragmites australis]|uniref:ninja-family protein Os03g0419100-like n=1 Tax=Phragmites australis TaxID=29695 RepID=UPI002D77EA11|nr:ninja-family protein Os03g0419100-like [Phragmites australis]
MASRDFLGVFGGRGGEAAQPEDAAGGGESDDIELNLGLSLGGRFGTETKRLRLVRSSSIATVYSVPSLDGDGNGPSPAAPPPLMRTSSLPTEPEEERWRRREMQSRRRLEARRKRIERRSSIGSSPSGPAKRGREDAGDAPAVVNGLQLRRLIGPQGSSSANTTEQGPGGSAFCQSTDARSPSTSDNTNQNNMLPPPTTATGKPPNGTTTEQPRLRTLGSLTTRTSSTSDFKKIMMEDMPMVSSKVEGPNGRRIDGFLYRYKKCEDVRIVCVCHGSFLTPAEFVKHAGGGDVSNPLRHIVVNPSPSVYL